MKSIVAFSILVLLFLSHAVFWLSQPTFFEKEQDFSQCIFEKEKLDYAHNIKNKEQFSADFFIDTCMRSKGYAKNNQEKLEQFCQLGKSVTSLCYLTPLEQKNGMTLHLLMILWYVLAPPLAILASFAGAGAL